MSSIVCRRFSHTIHRDGSCGRARNNAGQPRSGTTRQRLEPLLRARSDHEHGLGPCGRIRHSTGDTPR